VELRKYNTSPSSSSFTVVDVAGSGGNLVADIEGLAIYYGSTPNDGYLIASSQLESKYCVYQRGGNNTYLGKFGITAGSTIDAASNTDGLDVTNVNMGGIFSQGAFVVHDAANSPTDESNFKVVAFSKIATLGGLTTSTTYDPRVSLVPQPLPPQPSDYVNLLRPGGTWNTGGPGTVTIDPVSGQITIVADGSGLVYARRGLATQINKTYQLTWSNDTSAIMVRQIGTAEGLSDIRAAANSANGDNKIEFTATSATTWVSFQRTAAATVTISSLIFQEIPEGAASARRTNGKNQYFSLDAQASGLRMSNANWFIGGFVALTYIPAVSPLYFADFGRLDPGTTSGGGSRVRLFYDADQTKLACSTSEYSGANYRENYIISTLLPDTWYYLAMSALPSGDVQVILDTSRGASFVGTTLPAVSASEICRFLQIGARVVSPRTNFVPCRFSHWIWASGWIPTTDQVNALAGGTLPGDVAGLTPPGGGSLYHWPMSGATSEPSLINTAAPLTSNSSYGSIITVPGPMMSASVVPVTASPALLDVITA
jgi:hypothetical protein